MIKTAKAARPAAKKTSVRKSVPVKKAKADIEARLAPKAKVSPPDLSKLVETIQLGGIDEAARALEKFVATAKPAKFFELADLRKWAIEQVSRLDLGRQWADAAISVRGNSGTSRPTPFNEAISRADALVAFVLNGTVPK